MAESVKTYQVVAEVMEETVPKAKTYQVVAEVMEETIPKAKTYQVVAEVMSETIYHDITLVGTASGGHATDNYAITLPTCQAGDMIVVATGFSTNSNSNPGVVTSGYTEIADLYASDTGDIHLSVSYKIVGYTVDTEVVCIAPDPETNCYGVGVVYVLRGVDSLNPLDVVTATATGVSRRTPNPPPITPVTPNAWVLVCGAGSSYANEGDNTVTPPVGFSNNVVFGSPACSYASTVAMASKEWWYEGEIDAGEWESQFDGSLNSYNCWAAVTLAVRPGELVLPPPPAYVTREYTEVLRETLPPDALITREYTEVLRDTVYPDSHVTREYVEVLRQDLPPGNYVDIPTGVIGVIGHAPSVDILTTNVLVTQQYSEVAISEDSEAPYARVTSQYAEVAVFDPGVIAVPQVVVETLNWDTGLISVPQVAVEFLEQAPPGVASSPQVVVEMIYNPLAINPEGDFTTDFAEYTVGEAPSDWSEFFSSGDITYTAENNSGLTNPVNDQYLQVVSTGPDYLVMDASERTKHSSVLCAFSMTPSASGISIISRLKGTVGNENCYFFRVTSTSIEIGKVIAGTETVLSTMVFDQYSEEYWIRFNSIGTALKARIWNKYAIEPTHWNIETTDSDLISGSSGILVDSDTAYIDYFGLTAATNDLLTEILTPTLLSTGIVPTAVAPVHMPNVVTASVMGTWAHVYNSVTERKTVTGVRIYCTRHEDDIRVALYEGGTETDPAGASRLIDFGKSNGSVVDDWIEFTCSPILLPVNGLLWLFVKGDNPDGFYIARTPNLAHSGNAISGAYTVTSAIPEDPDIAYPSVVPEELLFTGTNTYKMEILLSDADPKVHRPTIVFVVT